MTDEIFFKRAKEAIVEHFNSHCKVGDMFEDEVPTTEEFVCLVWWGSTSDIRRAMFHVTSSFINNVMYSVFFVPTDEKMYLKAFKLIGHDCVTVNKKDAYATMDTILLEEGQKKCETENMFFFKFKGKDEPSDGICSKLKKKGDFKYD